MLNEEKAAVLLLSLDEDLAAAVMKNLRPAEIRRLGKQMGRITNVPTETVNSVTKEFCLLAQEQWDGLTVSIETSKKLVMKALGDGQTEEFMKDISSSANVDNPIIDKLRSQECCDGLVE